jgi:predicted NBD/HSP70 family sugar kinase
VQRNINVASAKVLMREKADIDLVRRQNRHVVLEALRLHGPMPRVVLGRLTGLSPASITSITNQLLAEKATLEMEDGLLRDPSRRGRPTVLLGLNPKAANIIGLKISIGEVAMALADFSGKITARKHYAVDTYPMRPDDFSLFLVKTISAFISENNLSNTNIARIGIAAQGVADSRLGVIAWSPAFKARHIPIVAAIETELGIKCDLANDANMIAEGVMALDRYNYTGTAAVIYMGYGVGMGLIINGAVYHGSTGAAAEFGHMNHVPGGAACRCGRAGCLEAYASDYAILRNAQNLADVSPAPSSAVPADVMQNLEQAARNGDANAISAYQTAGRAIGFGLARLIALLNPDRIVLSGPSIRALDLIEPALQAAIEEAVVPELRHLVKFETVPIDVDMIITGTIDAALRHLDSEIFASGPLAVESVT